MKPIVIFALASLSIFAQDLRLMSDTNTRASMPDTPLGSLPQLAVDPSSTTYLQFDTSLIAISQRPEDLITATLRLYVNRLTTPGAISVAAYCRAVQEDWLTHNNRMIPLCNSFVSTLPVLAAQSFIDIDVTERVRTALNVGTALSLLITPAQSAPNTSVLFDSKESSTTSHAPQLMLNFKPLFLVGPQGPVGPAGPTGPAGPAGPEGPAGSVRTISWQSYRGSCDGGGICARTLSCGLNSVVITGGCGHRDFNNATSDIVVNYSGPSLDGPRSTFGSVVDGWSCRVSNLNIFASRDWEAWVACMNVR